MKNSDLMTIKQAAKLSGIRYGDIAKAIKTGDLESVDISMYKFVQRSALDEWMKSRRVRHYEKLGEGKYRTITTNIREQTYEKARRYAEGRGVSLASYIRNVVEMAIKKEEEE